MANRDTSTTFPSRQSSIERRKEGRLSSMLRFMHRPTDADASCTLTCVVCLDELSATIYEDALLPCCGREGTSDRVCRACLQRVCESASAACPLCRTELVFDRASPSFANVMFPDDTDAEAASSQKAHHHRLLSPIIWLLSPIWRCFLSILLVLLRPVAYTADAVLQQTLEAVFSRGPV